MCITEFMIIGCLGRQDSQGIGTLRREGDSKVLRFLSEGRT